MAAYRTKGDKQWRYRKKFRYPDGNPDEVSGTPAINRKDEAEREEREAHDRAVRQWEIARSPRKEVPTFEEWFNGRFWTEWVLGRKNSPSEQLNKRSYFENHLKQAFSSTKLNEITYSRVVAFRAGLVAEGLSAKHINNILLTLSAALRHAVDVELIDKKPKMGLLKITPGEKVWWELEEYARVLEASKAYGPFWHAAVVLTGEAGLRIGEVRALQWADIDIVGRTITISKQRKNGIEGPPKGKLVRRVPMTSFVCETLRRMEVLPRRGYVCRNADGTPFRDSQTMKRIIKVYRKAGLSEKAERAGKVGLGGWHVMRHSYATHAAQFGINAFRLQAWLGHKSIEQTMEYVHLANDHARPLPEELLAIGTSETDPDRRVVAMLGGRNLGQNWAKNQDQESQTEGLLGS